MSHTVVFLKPDNNSGVKEMATFKSLDAEGESCAYGSKLVPDEGCQAGAHGRSLLSHQLALQEEAQL